MINLFNIICFIHCFNTYYVTLLSFFLFNNQIKILDYILVAGLLPVTAIIQSQCIPTRYENYTYRFLSTSSNIADSLDCFGSTFIFYLDIPLRGPVYCEQGFTVVNYYTCLDYIIFGKSKIKEGSFRNITLSIRPSPYIWYIFFSKQFLIK